MNFEMFRKLNLLKNTQMMPTNLLNSRRYNIIMIVSVVSEVIDAPLMGGQIATRVNASDSKPITFLCMKGDA